jgi:ABC-2 type transport system permease protein
MSSSPSSDAVELAPGSTATIGQVPRTWEQIFKLAHFQFRDYLRSRRFVLMMGIVAIIGVILTALVGYYRPGILLDPNQGGGVLPYYAELWGSGVTVVIVFAGVIFGGDAIAGEFQNKTGYFLMALPIRRSAIYIGKYIAAFLAALIAVIFYALIIIGNSAFYFGWSAMQWGLLYSFILALVYLLALLGATFLFSSLFKTSTYATLVVAILFLFGFTILQDVIQGLVHITPWFVLTYADTIISGVFNVSCLTNPGTHSCSTFGPGGRPITETVTNATIPQGVGIMLGYFIITAVIGLLLFEREEFT